MTESWYFFEWQNDGEGNGQMQHEMTLPSQELEYHPLQKRALGYIPSQRNERNTARAS